VQHSCCDVFRCGRRQFLESLRPEQRSFYLIKKMMKEKERLTLANTVCCCIVVLSEELPSLPKYGKLRTCNIYIYSTLIN
jgi:hypothetical protein